MMADSCHFPVTEINEYFISSLLMFWKNMFMCFSLVPSLRYQFRDSFSLKQPARTKYGKIYCRIWKPFVFSLYNISFPSRIYCGEAHPSVSFYLRSLHWNLNFRFQPEYNLNVSIVVYCRRTELPSMNVGTVLLLWCWFGKNQRQGSPRVLCFETRYYNSFITIFFSDFTDYNSTELFC